MSLGGIVRTIAHTVIAHPKLLQWYLQTRGRRHSLRRELERGSPISSRPLGITLKPTYCCNLRCSMCAFVASGAVEAHPRDSLPVEPWARLIDDVAQYKPYIWFTGGEPTLYPGFVSLIRAARDRGLLCGVTTNGTTLERLADDLAEQPMHILVVSLDGGEDVHNRVRGCSVAYERAIAGLEALRHACRKRRTNGPALVLNCSLSPANYREAAEMADTARRFGAECINVQHLWMMTHGMIEAHNRRWGDAHYLDPGEWGDGRVPEMDPDAVMATITEIRRRASGIPVLVHPDLSVEETRVYYRQPESFVRRRKAACAWINTDVLPNGDISPCFGLTCGNITRSRLSDVWNGADFQKHRQRMSVDGDLPICTRCCAYWRRV